MIRERVRIVGCLVGLAVTGGCASSPAKPPVPAATSAAAPAATVDGSDYVLKFSELGPHDAGPGERIYLMRGEDHGFDALSLIMTETEPQGGPPLHTHDSEEAHVLYEGTVTYQIGDERFTVSGPYVARVPAGVPHTFINSGTRRFNLTCAFPTKHYTFQFVGPNPLLASRDEPKGEAGHHAGHALGTADFPITCSKQAQVEFNRAIALLHHMTYPQAREAFEKVEKTDPKCAMAHWGIATTLFQPLWPTRPRPEALQRGWDAVQKAKSLQPPTERERLFVAAAEAFFLEPASPDYWLRIRRWEQAMEKVYTSLPEDPEAAAFYALAHLATTPSNAISRAHADRAAEILLGVYKRNPDHPGAMHYLVHANDVPGREQESLEITRKYEAVAPRNPHALHMPTHIYTRLGDWNGVIRGNLLSAEAALEHPAGDRGELVWDEFPHAIEYLVYAQLQKGADDGAAEQLRRLRSTARLEPTFKTAFHLASTQARYALERRAWNEAVLLVPREPASLDWDRFTWPEAIARFAHGLGAAHLGKVVEAKADVKRLEELEGATTKAGEELFARNIRVLRLELSAWLAHVEQQRASSVALMREAAELEASTPKHAVTPGPTLPAQELLGDLLLEQKQPAEALAAYKRSMELYPKRFNGLLGAARAASALGDEPLARSFYQELLKVAEGGTRQPVLKEAKDYLAQGR